MNERIIKAADEMNSWYDRINVPRKIAKLCQRCTDSFYFWLIAGLFTLIEPILCSRYPKGFILRLQVIVLLVSSGLYVIQLLGVATREWEKIHKMQMEMNDDLVPVVKVKDMKILKLFIFFTAEGEYMFECACLVLGWVFIFVRPGIATLRCFRVYRLLW